MESDAVEDELWKVPLQPDRTNILMFSIDIMVGDVFAKSMKKVTDVME
jgi:hypothetical protein